jgi:hypothetical protein
MAKNDRLYLALDIGGTKTSMDSVWTVRWMGLSVF